MFRWEPEEKLPSRAKNWVAAALVPFLLLGALELTHGRRRVDARRIFESVQEPKPRPVCPDTR
jgi:hypothetical protein